jgi:hypothetical protein
VRLSDSAFPPLAAVLMVAGGLQGDPGEGVEEGVEDEQFGLEAADLADKAGFLVAVEPLEHVAGGGDLGPRAGADVLADHAAVDAAGAVVVPLAILAADFPGHGRLRSGGFAGRYTTTGRAARRRGR